MKSTPTPWKYTSDPRVDKKVYGEYGETIAVCAKAKDAEFIVRMANVHCALVEALRTLHVESGIDSLAIDRLIWKAEGKK